jgi:ribonuclease D
VITDPPSAVLAAAPVITEAARTTHYIDREEQLSAALAELARSDFVALDTEFMRESTYYPKLCLLQLSTLDYCAVLDPLAIENLAPLWSFLEDASRLKILHAARQDLEVMAVHAPDRAALSPIFDTQIAAALLGHSAQIGYAALVSARLQHSLPKGHTRADWSKRPLSLEQIEYAADDVRYLAALYVDLRQQLVERDRLQWLEEETRGLGDANLHKVEPHLAWRRLKGLDRLKPEQRATAKRLAQWREEAAIRHDRPRGWILADESLREISERLPREAAQLDQLRTVPAGLIRKRGAELLELVNAGIRERESEAEQAVFSRPDPEQLARVSALMAFVRTEGERLNVSPELLATRKDLEQLVFSNKREPLLNGWRAEVIGKRLVEIAERSATR